MKSLEERSLEAEQAIIGAALISDGLLNDCDLNEGEFLNATHRAIWKVCRDIHGNKQSVDIVSVLSAMGSDNYKTYLMDCARNCPSSANWQTYADHVRKYSRCAKASRLFRDGLVKAESGSLDFDSLIKELMQIDKASEKYEYTIKEALGASIDHLEKVVKGEIKTIPTGINRFDDLFGGLHNSDLVVIAGRPAMGKTAVSLNFAYNAGVPVGIISSEMKAEQLATRMISIVGRVHSHNLRNGKLTSDDWSKVTAATVALAGPNHISINDQSVITISEIARQARKWKHSNGIQMLVVDYIQRIATEDKRMARHEHVGEVVRGLKSLAKELDIPVIALAQVRREVESRNDKRPHMGDIADSSEVEKEADVVVTLYRDEVYNDDSDQKGLIEYIVCKNRHGDTGAIRARWRPEYMLLENLPDGYSAYPEAR